VSGVTVCVVEPRWPVTPVCLSVAPVSIAPRSLRLHPQTPARLPSLTLNLSAHMPAVKGKTGEMRLASTITAERYPTQPCALQNRVAEPSHCTPTGSVYPPGLLR
jgi:hypothetical protein